MKLSELPHRLVRGVGPTKPRLVSIRRGTLRGRKMMLSLATEKAYWLGVYEREVERELRRLAQPGTIAFDVGAHVGYFSLMLAALCGEVVAVEPDPRNAEGLEGNVRLNEMRVHVIRAVASSEAGSIGFARDALSEMGRVSDGNGIQTEAVTLDDLAARYGNPRIVKIDVEGHEDAVLAGAVRVLDAGAAVLCEIHGKEAALAVRAALVARGCSVRQVDGVRSWLIGESPLLARRT